MTTRPRVLLVIPTLGRRLTFLERTLESIAAQRDEPARLIMVVPQDAGGARALAARFSAEVVDDPGGMAAAINRGWAAATTADEYLGWIGDDDVLLAGALRTAATALDALPAAVVAFGYCDYITDDDRLIWTSRAGRFAPSLITWGPDLVPQPGSLFRRSAVDEVGQLDETLTHALDLDLLLRLRRVGSFVNTRQTLAQFRWHGESATVSDRSQSLHESELVKRRYYSPLQARAALLWEQPVRLATRLAARRLNHRMAGR